MVTAHIATVHWGSDSWIGIQQSYLKAYFQIPYKLYGFVYPHKEAQSSLTSGYEYVNTEPIVEHHTKLNLLAEIIKQSANPSDIIIFIDGDAFPVSTITEDFFKPLETNEFMAIRLDENLGDPVPHPSFFACKLSTWVKHEFNWNPGPMWQTPLGKVTDTGATILKISTEKGLRWKPLLRSNKTNLHPLWFGVYENAIYHHGAGFREPISRVDRKEMDCAKPGLCLRLVGKLQRYLSIKNLYRFQRYSGIRMRIVQKNRQLSGSVFEQIKADQTLTIIKKLFC
ncbi:hypothetical protein DSECCO2_204280 [anaerobic digester metagenome]